MRRTIRSTLAVIGMAGLLVAARPAQAQVKDPAYPARPITLYIAFGAGGNTDIATRALAQAASKHLGQPIIPVNRPGAGGTIAAMAVMNAAPDGYTIGTNAGSSVLMIPHMDDMPYRDLSGFTLIMNYGKFIFPLLVSGDSPWKNWNDLIQWAKQNPKQLSVGITSVQAISPMGIALYRAEQKENVQFTYVPLKGSAEVLNYTLGGHIKLFASSFDPAVLQLLRNGKLRLLAYLSTEKAEGFENYPTFKELYDEVPPNLGGIWGPKGMPEHVLKKLDDAFAKAAKDPDFVKVMASMSMPVVYMNHEEINNYARENLPKVGEVMRILKSQEATKGK